MPNKRYRTSAHSRYTIYYHLVFCPKYRREIFKELTIDKHTKEAIKKMSPHHDWIIYDNHPEIKKYLWGGKMWCEGYYVSTISDRTTKEEMRRYVCQQKNRLKQLKLL